MSTRIRLRRMGANKRPFYRVVVADQRSPRNGRFIENIGRYHPLEEPSLIEIDEERALHWLRVGAQPSSQVRNLMDKIGIWSKFVAERPSAAIAPKPGRSDEAPKPAKVSKKAASKAKAAATAPAPAPAPAPVVEATPEPEPEVVEVAEAVPEAAEVAPEAAEAVPEAAEAPAADAEAPAQE